MSTTATGPARPKVCALIKALQEEPQTVASLEVASDMGEGAVRDWLAAFHAAQLVTVTRGETPAHGRGSARLLYAWRFAPGRALTPVLRGLGIPNTPPAHETVFRGLSLQDRYRWIACDARVQLREAISLCAAEGRPYVGDFVAVKAYADHQMNLRRAEGRRARDRVTRGYALSLLGVPADYPISDEVVETKRAALKLHRAVKQAKLAIKEEHETVAKPA